MWAKYLIIVYFLLKENYLFKRLQNIKLPIILKRGAFALKKNYRLVILSIVFCHDLSSTLEQVKEHLSTSISSENLRSPIITNMDLKCTPACVFALWTNSRFVLITDQIFNALLFLGSPPPPPKKEQQKAT